MSETAKKLFEGLRAMAETVQEMAPGLQDIGPQVGAEFGRLANQGAIELASALFNGHGFVPYGPGQNPATVEQQPQHEQEKANEQADMDRGMER